jgi:type IV pilus assembly protein PilB
MSINNHLLDVLKDENIITEDKYNEIKTLSINSDRNIEEILASKYSIPPDDILMAKAKVFHVRSIKLSGKGISPEILNFIPEAVARKYLVIPFDYDKQNGQLSLAMVNPTDLPLLSFLEQKSGKSIVPFLADRDEIIQKIESEYSQGLAVEVSEALKETTIDKVQTLDANELSKVIKQAPISKIVSTILEYAMKARSSDIHIEPEEARTRIRYRIDGILNERLVLPRNVHDAVVSRIKILSDMKIDEKRIPQDGRFNFKIGEDEVDLRVSTLPTVHGEKVVMRLLKKTGGIPDLPSLGLTGLSLKILHQNITRPHGIILVTGPTGSGKTTTLYSVLSRLNTVGVNIVTLEDPVEYEIVGLNQVQINPQAGLTFASGLRSFLRQDPNIILVGEIRDGETTALAVQAALTGHLVFSTLHTNNASTAIPRLLDLGAEPFLIASVLNAAMAQRIVRKICSSCKESYVPPAEIINEFKAALGPLYPQEKNQTLFYKGKGCKECNNTGYLGRVGIFEIINISSQIAKLILHRSSAEEIEKLAISEGLITLKQDGYLKVINGITTLEEVHRVAQE